jgi:hypothetical protein
MKRFLMLFALLGLALGLHGCGGSNNNNGVAPVSGTGGSSSGGGSSTGTSGSSIARDGRAGGNYLDVLSFPIGAILPVQCKDCIPALTDPQFVSANDDGAGYLRTDDIVIGVVVNGEARAYPHNIGWWHEIVNDNVGGTPIIVTLCPLTGTGMVFNGRAEDGSRITLGVSGLLFNNNLVMYDRRDQETLYPQMTYKAVVGPRQGESLELLPMTETTWGYWQKMYPNTKVLSGHAGGYGIGRYTVYPYTDEGDYRFVHEYILFPLNDTSTASFFGAKDMAMGVRFGDILKSYPFQSMLDEDVINDSVSEGGKVHNIVIANYKEGKMAVPFSRDLVDGEGNVTTLTFQKVSSSVTTYPFMLRDTETSTTWNLKGEGISGPNEGKKLTQLPSHNGFWFAWGTFWENIGVH